MYKNEHQGKLNWWRESFSRFRPFACLPPDSGGKADIRQPLLGADAVEKGLEEPREQ